MTLEFYRSPHGYGWSVTLVWRGQHRVRWCSRRATTPMRPRIIWGGDEDCNRAVTLVLWPLGSLDIWYEHPYRPAGTGMCDDCNRELAALRGVEPKAAPSSGSPA